MTLNVNGLILTVIVLLYLVFYLAFKAVLNKFTTLDVQYVRQHKRLSTMLSLINHQFEGTLESLRDVKHLKQNLILDNMDIRLQTKALLKFEIKEIKRLKHRNKMKRKEASTYLGLIGSQRAKSELECALMSEKDASVKIYISNALADIKHPSSLNVMIPALLNSHKWYREKGISNILEYGAAIQPHFEALVKTQRLEYIELLLKYASENFNESTKAYLFQFVDDFEHIKSMLFANYENLIQDGKTTYKLSYLETDLDALLTLSCRTLSNYYYPEFNGVKYYRHTNVIIQTNGFWALSKSGTTENFKVLLDFLVSEQYEKVIINVLTTMVEVNPRFLYLVEEAFTNSEDASTKRRLAQVLSNKIEYYILKLSHKNDFRSEQIVIEVVQNKKINELIGFMNINKNVDLENRLIKLLKAQIESGSDMELELRTYINERILDKWGLTPYKVTKITALHQKDSRLTQSLIFLTLLSVLFVPFIFLLSRKAWVWTAPPLTVLTQFVIDFNYSLAFYAIAINAIYISLLILSYQNVKGQAKLWAMKNISMLFRPKMIPSISIIAPAYNEEKNIVESTKSLLNLKYPDYELIIVNDGSKDDTLLKLIQAFGLIRVDYYYTASLKTEPIRGIYRNASLPKLVVIDKSNGGKADSLNAGINVANKVYFCGIDADSLLEPEALLRLASLTLDESTETPALGGNILPINGCTIDNGLITSIALPKNSLARFQTIEYLRAFMAGRLGWQKINSLLIISGAFGLFRKDRIIGIGGYMTQKGVYNKDTVGEDMELVVRISRMMHEMNLKYKILYAFNANCWTEVPEDLKSLKSQRFRWHRGLVDILFYHRKMLFNKAYGKVGIFAMPYFFIFEVFGPMLEFQGYVMVILAALLGILDSNIALLLFISSVLMGMVVSISSLLIAERETNYFSPKDLLKLIGYAFAENFGPRQLFSIWRVWAQINVIFAKQGSWGQIKRRGISS